MFSPSHGKDFEKEISTNRQAGLRNYGDNAVKKADINKYYDKVNSVWSKYKPKGKLADKPSKELKKSNPEKYHQIMHSRREYRNASKAAYRKTLMDFARTNFRSQKSASWWIDRK